MKNTNIFHLGRQAGRRLTTLVAMVAMVFSVGCTNDLKGELDDLTGRVEKLEDIVEALDQKLAEGAMITSVTPLTAPESGWLIEFSGDKEPIKIINGNNGANGTTPQVEVRTNSDGSITIWVNNGDGWVDTGINIKGDKGEEGEKGDPGTPGNSAPAVQIEVRTNSDSTTTIWYNVGNGWVNTNVDLSVPSSQGGLKVIVENADGSITFILNDGQDTEYTFARYSTATGFELTTTAAIEFNGDGTDSREIKFIVNPSNAWIQTGNDVSKWAVNQTGTRASYITPSEVFTIESILPDGDKQGQYIATIASDFTKHDAAVEEYDLMLVFNNNQSADTTTDSFVASRAFAAKFTEVSIIAEGNSGSLHWVLNSAGTFTISGTGDIANSWEGGSNRIYGSYASQMKKVVLEDGVGVIGPFAFEGAPALEEVVIGNTVPRIAQYAFYNCSKLEKVTIGSNVTSIANQTFKGCVSMTSISMPEGLIDIGSDAFGGCIGLETITIPGTVTTMVPGTFASCYNLKEINVTTTAPGQAFVSVDGVLFTGNKEVLIQYPAKREATHYDIPAGTLMIAQAGFSSSANLATVNIPEGLTTIDNQSFLRSTALTTITVPASVVHLGHNSFEGCTSLTSATIMAQTWTTNYAAGGPFYGIYLFDFDENLKDITLGATVPPTTGGGIFTNFNTGACTLHVPAGSAAAYEADPIWSTFGSIVGY